MKQVKYYGKWYDCEAIVGPDKIGMCCAVVVDEGCVIARYITSLDLPDRIREKPGEAPASEADDGWQITQLADGEIWLIYRVVGKWNEYISFDGETATIRWRSQFSTFADAEAALAKWREKNRKPTPPMDDARVREIVRDEIRKAGVTK